MDWKEKAIRTLRYSLYPVPEDLNELDWKSGLSNKSERLAQHNPNSQTIKVVDRFAS